MKQFFYYIFIVFTLFAFTPAHAKSIGVVWLNENTMQNKDLTISRPNMRWRFDLNKQDGTLQMLRYYRNGHDILIEFDVHHQHLNASIQKKRKQQLSFNTFKKNLISVYEHQNFKISSFTQPSKNSVLLEGLNEQQQHLIAYIRLKNENVLDDFISMKTVLDHKDYDEFKQAFMKVSLSLIPR